VKRRIQHLEVLYLLGTVSKAEYLTGLEELYKEFWR
jgi:hypothetical protein